MTESNVNISYDLDELLKYKDINNVLPEELQEYCLTINDSPLNIRPELIFEMKNITDSILNGLDPNDIVLKSSIREFLNKISKGNFDEYLSKLINLNYSNQQHYELLIYEILSRSMNDPVTSKGFDPSNTDVYISNINVDICKYFCDNFVIETNNISFKNILINLCKAQFKDFLDHNKYLDNNNKHRVDNFKGFMNFLGLLHNNQIISGEIILSCLELLKKLIYKSSWGEFECTNVFIGYDRLLNQLSFGILNNLEEYNSDYIDNIIKITESFKEENIKNEKLRRIPMLTHSNILKKLN